MPANLSKTDFYAWTPEQSKLLKEGDFKHRLSRLPTGLGQVLAFTPQPSPSP